LVGLGAQNPGNWIVVPVDVGGELGAQNPGNWTFVPVCVGEPTLNGLYTVVDGPGGVPCVDFADAVPAQTPTATTTDARPMPATAAIFLKFIIILSRGVSLLF
jgi:hypothetical protein